MGRLVVFGSGRIPTGKKRPDRLKSAWQWVTRPRYVPLKMIQANNSVMGFNPILLWESKALFHRLLTQLADLDQDPPQRGPFSSLQPTTGSPGVPEGTADKVVLNVVGEES